MVDDYVGWNGHHAISHNDVAADIATNYQLHSCHLGNKYPLLATACSGLVIDGDNKWRFFHAFIFQVILIILHIDMQRAQHTLHNATKG